MISKCVYVSSTRTNTEQEEPVEYAAELDALTCERSLTTESGIECISLLPDPDQLPSFLKADITKKHQ